MSEDYDACPPMFPFYTRQTWLGVAYWESATAFVWGFQSLSGRLWIRMADKDPLKENG